MTFSESITTVFKKTFVYQGRASRSEYWYYTLFFCLICLLILLVSFINLNAGTILSYVSMLLYIPAISVGVRRLHDINSSGWKCLIVLIPIIGLVVLYWFCKKGTEGENKYGPDPLQ